MRTVRRRYTEAEPIPEIAPFQQPRPPWTWRGQAPTGAPRTLLSHHKDTITVQRGDRRYAVGKLDWMLRLYQHSGVTQKDARNEDYVLYDVDEWNRALGAAEWIEFVDTDREMVLRTDKKKAILSRRTVRNGEDYRFGVPITAFEAYERD